MSYTEFLALPVRPRSWLAVRLLRRLGKWTGGTSSRDLTMEECAEIDGNDLAALKEVFPHALA